MQVGLRLAKIKYESQKVVELKFKDHHVGEGYPDLIVRLSGGKMVVELKAVSGELGASEEQQIRNYMKILKIDRGLLINFQQPGKNPKKAKLEIKENHKNPRKLSPNPNPFDDRARRSHRPADLWRNTATTDSRQRGQRKLAGGRYRPKRDAPYRNAACMSSANTSGSYISM
jgi:GxxExxY protein